MRSESVRVSSIEPATKLSGIDPVKCKHPKHRLGPTLIDHREYREVGNYCPRTRKKREKRKQKPTGKSINALIEYFH